MNFGDQVRDTISGLRGQVTGEATYASGQHQFQVQPRLDPSGRYRDPVWVDAYRLVVDEGGDIMSFTIQKRETGAPQ